MAISPVSGLFIALTIAQTHKPITQFKKSSGIAMKRVTINADGRDVAVVLKELFESVGASYVINNSVRGKVSSHLNNVPFSAALSALLHSSLPPLELHFDGVVFMVSKEDEVGGRAWPIESGFRLDYIHLYSRPAQDVADLLRDNPEFGPTTGTSIQVNVVDNSLTVGGQIETIRLMKDRIRFLDRRGPNVDLKAQVVVTTTSKTGVEKIDVWEMSSRAMNGEKGWMKHVLPHSSGSWSMNATPLSQGDHAFLIHADVSCQVKAPINGKGSTKRPVSVAFKGSWVIDEGKTGLMHTAQFPPSSDQERVSLKFYLQPRIAASEYRNDQYKVVPIHDYYTTLLADVENKGVEVDRDVTDQVDKSLLSRLQDTRYFEVIQKQAVLDGLKELRLTTPLTSDQRLILAKRLEARAIVVPTLEPVDNNSVRSGKAPAAWLRVRMERPGPYYATLMDLRTGIWIDPGTKQENLKAEWTRELARAANALAGELERSAPEQGYALRGGDTDVVINLGKTKGVKPGSILLVLRGSLVVGRIEVVKAFEHYSLAKDLGTENGVREEDSVYLVGGPRTILNSRP